MLNKLGIELVVDDVDKGDGGGVGAKGETGTTPLREEADAYGIGAGPHMFASMGAA